MTFLTSVNVITHHYILLQSALTSLAVLITLPWERLHLSLPQFMSLPLNSSWQKVHNWLTVLTLHSMQETTIGLLR